MVKGQRNKAAARQYYDWLMSPAGQSIGGKASSLQVPANKTFKLDPKIPLLDNVRLIKYDFEKYGKAAERRRLLERWTKEVESLPMCFLYGSLHVLAGRSAQAGSPVKFRRHCFT